MAQERSPATTDEYPADGRDRGTSWWQRVPQAAKAAAGAIITLAAVVAALQQLGVIGSGSAKMAGKLSRLDVRPGVTLAEYRLREQAGGGAGGATGALPRRRVRLAAFAQVAQVAQVATETPTPALTETPVPTETPSPSETPTATETPSATETPVATATDDPGATPSSRFTPAASCDRDGEAPGITLAPVSPHQSAIPRSCLAKDQRARLFSRLTQPELPVLTVPQLPQHIQFQFQRVQGVDLSCVTPADGQASCSPSPSFPQDSRTFPDTAAGRRTAAGFALQMLTQVRTRPAGRRGKRDAVGALLTYKLRLVGLEGERVAIGWSLWTKGSHPHLPRSWLYTRRAAIVKAEANDDTADGAVWVPLPKSKGPFFVRLTAFDARGTALDNADSRAFK